MHISFDAGQVLRETLNLWRGRVPHEDDFRAFGAMCAAAGGLTLLDCGANAGQSVVSFLMCCPGGRVVSFEPNPLYEPVLAGLRAEIGAQKFDYFVEGMSDRHETVPLHVPFVNGRPYLQEAAMDMAQFDKPWVAERLRSYGNDVQFRSFAARFVTADSKGLDADAVKIDAEGSELRVLAGMTDTVRRCRPVFMIENNDWHRVTDYLGKLGYGCYRWDGGVGRLVPMHGTCTNSFYLLDEHRVRFSGSIA